MRIVANISITLTTLILLVFGAGGVSVTKCACSGKTSLLTMSDAGCCPSEGGCMSVTSVQLSDSDLPVHFDAPELMPAVVSLPAFQCSLPAPQSQFFMPHTPLSTGYPPPQLPLTTVLQV